MAADVKVRVLIVDDELLARQRLEDLLRAEEDVEILGLIDNGHEAVDNIRSLKPDLVFLDVQMPGLTGVDVVEEVGAEAMPVTIFVTAYDQFALKAFDLAAVDYLLKPFDDDRFDQALARARKLISLQEVDAARGRLLTLLQGGEQSPPPTPPKPSYLERIAVEMRGQVRIVPVATVDYVTASGPYAELHVGEDTFIIRERMQTLEDRLNPTQFFRIHRSTIVRLDLIESLLLGVGGDYAVRLTTGKHLKVSRSRREALEQRLGLNSKT